MRHSLLVLVALALASPAAAQQPVRVVVAGAPASATNPQAVCITDTTACITSFQPIRTADLNTTGTTSTEIVGIALEGAGGPVAVSPNVPLPVITTTASTIGAVGNIASGAADSGAPLKVGGIAYTSALPTSVTNAQRVNGFFDKSGRQVVTSNPREFRLGGSRVSLTATTETTVVAQAASTFHDLVTATCTNESATEVRVDWRDSTGGTVRFSMDLAPDGGSSNLFWGTDGWPQATANNNWTVQMSGTVSTVYCSALVRKDL